MNKFLKWLSNSPTAAVLKVALGGLLVIVFDSINSYNLPPIAALAITALIPVIVDALNPNDPRFGKGKAPSLAQFIEVIDAIVENHKADNKNSKAKES